MVVTTEMNERNDEFDLADPETWTKEVMLADGQVVNAPVMLLIAQEQNES